ncbi:uncharacterized protein LOC114519649 [Dendronephthya gigantea]|uniref:uncharacterized protein LOC114519649 n=1 Tax=Dendronephthya gigantea TaxID=151771 RepID=UPI001069F4AE|nr:uncharacterized protein LOC114519649 [Dendronephthya gigantea]
MQRYEESVIPNGVKRTWHINYNVSTRQASDCQKTVHLCRRKSPDADKPEKCESGKVKLFLHVNTCEFTLVYNDTSNNTAQFHVEFYPSGVQGNYNPQLFLLSTKSRGVSTDPPATTNRSHRSETTTSIASKSEMQETITTPKGPTSTKNQGVPQFPTATTTQKRTPSSASNPSTKEQNNTGEQSGTNPTKAPPLLVCLIFGKWLLDWFVLQY